MRTPTLMIMMMVCALPAARATDWRDVFREYERLRADRIAYEKEFPGFDPEMARMGAAFAAKAYPENPALGRKNFRRLALRLRVSTPNDYVRKRIFTPAETPWPEYGGKVTGDGMAHFLVNHGTLPLALFDHPVTGIIRKHPVKFARALPLSACAARILRQENVDMTVIEHDAVAREKLLRKIRAAFDAEHPSEPMTDEEAACFAECVIFMA